jgi:hypothetical protein
MSITPMPVEQRQARNAGPLMSGWEVARVAALALYERLPAWLDETARQQGTVARVQRPMWVGLRDNDDPQAKGKRPQVVVDYRTSRYSQGSDYYRAEIALRILAVIDDTKLGEALRKAAVYEIAIAACLTNSMHLYSDMVRDIAPAASGVDAMDPSGAVADVLMTVQAEAVMDRGPVLLPPDPIEPGPDDQGDQPVVIATNLDLTVRPASNPGDADGDEA